MGTKKNLTVEEAEDIKKSRDFLGEEVYAVRLQQKSILQLVEELKTLRLQNAVKDNRLAYLESRAAELEQYMRINNVVITGIQIKTR